MSQRIDGLDRDNIVRLRREPCGIAPRSGPDIQYVGRTSGQVLDNWRKQVGRGNAFDPLNEVARCGVFIAFQDVRSHTAYQTCSDQTVQDPPGFVIAAGRQGRYRFIL